MTDDIIEQIKSKIRIEDQVEADGYPLPKRGRYRKCSTPHAGGLVINVDLQMYYWNTQAEHGDVIAWVMRRKGMDFKEAVEHLARQAGLPEPHWRGEDQGLRMAARAREEAMDVAQRVFMRWFERSPEAQAYAKGRGWSEGSDEEPGTLQAAMLGYSGEGSEEERAEMRRELQAAGVDLSSPAAVAILGLRGDVAGWARAHDLQVSDDWIAGGYIPGLVGRKRLVYAHVRGGRVRYLSARSIEGKFHYNLPEVLIGKRQPYFNHVYSAAAEEVVVVEGQADAISLGQMGIPAVALAGVAPGEELAELLKGHRALYVGLDADAAGEKNRWRVADALGPMARMVAWNGLHEYRRFGEDREVKDANDLLRAMVLAGLDGEGQAAAVRGMMRQAPTYVEAICAWAGRQEGAAKEAGQVEALKVVARLDTMQRSQYRSTLAKALGVTVREMDNMLKALHAIVEEERSRGEPVYTWGGLIDGWLVEYLYDVERDQASLAWRDPQGKIGSGESVKIEGRSYMPYPPNDTLKSGAITFPSQLGEQRSMTDIVTYIKMYLHAIYLFPSEEMVGLAAYWVLTTWVYDAFETVIYLRAMGGAGSGKSELIKRIGMICYRTMTANGAGSTSSLFRSLERYKGTVLLDEADIQQSDTENDMVKFYNLGAMRGNPIWRTIEVTGPNGEKDWEAVSFQTFCPKLIAMRKEFRDDAVGTRSITLKLNSAEMTELRAAGINLTVNGQIRARAQALRNLLVRWRLETWQPEIEVDADLYDMTISARLNQVAGPMLALAQNDPAQQEEIRYTLREYYRESIISQSMTIGARVIEAMWKIWQYPDLRKEMVKQESTGEFIIKIGDITRISNELINEMNDTGGEKEEEEDKKRFGSRELSSQKIGRIIRTELQLRVSERRRDGFWVYWNEPRIIGLSTRFGINPEDFKPVAAKAQMQQATILQP